MLNRRQFLQTSSIVSLSPMLPCIFGTTARAAGAGVDERVLVVVQLDGGNDGLNTVVPYADDAYGRARKKLRLETDKLLKLDDHVGLHPSMQGVKQLFDEGLLTVVQNVGYPNPNRSHFSSMRIWQTAQSDEAAHNGYGWLGRTLDQQLLQAKPKIGSDAIFVGEREIPVALWGRRSSATAFDRTNDLRLEMEVTAGHASNDGVDNLEQFVTKQVYQAYAASAEFERQEMHESGPGDNKYPDTGLAGRLKVVSRLLQSGSHARVYYAVQDGYDTHAAQLYTHARLLKEFSDAVKAFFDDLQKVGLADRVLLLAFSEFGRRVQENDSQGTDHGTAGPVFVAGTSLRDRLIGGAPNLTDLDNGDLKMQVDFRGIYATILDEWLAVDANKVLRNTFKRLPLITA